MLEEAGVAESWNSPPVAELPTRGISGVAVFEVADDRLPMRDLEVLDDQAHPTIDVVGSLTKLDDDGKPVLDAEPGAPRPIAQAPTLMVALALILTITLTRTPGSSRDVTSRISASWPLIWPVMLFLA